jgi:glycosyltransferase involved in cell wall biosynthesis
LKVIGSGGEREESAMFQLVDELGIGKRFWHGSGLSAPEIAGVMKDCSIFLLPTRIDTGPTALKEALVMGLWPVCYENSGPAEYVRLCRFGTLAEDGNFNDLREKLYSAVRTRPWEDSSTRMQLKEFTRKRFSQVEIWNQLIELYEEISSSAA